MFNADEKQDFFGVDPFTFYRIQDRWSRRTPWSPDLMGPSEAIQMTAVVRLARISGSCSS